MITLLGLIPMAAYASHKFGSVSRSAFAKSIGRDGLNQSFIGVRSRAVAGIRISRSRNEWVAAACGAFLDLCTRCRADGSNVLASVGLGISA